MELEAVRREIEEEGNWREKTRKRGQHEQETTQTA